ncbi:hypothetical protein EYF80_031384 [Liparis tanakae]|uniref:Uncharacterized protein n=1 Tax=Liparis tanakae TaxID=230148 RepID=A0A4Z2H027_9TELE|nr:hypothetical protein EYF80_031384 [Liparis tanakae]
MVRWVFQRGGGGGEVHLEMLRASRLVSAAVTSRSISLFYGHERLRSSPSPFGASLGTSNWSDVSLYFDQTTPNSIRVAPGV